MSLESPDQDHFACRIYGTCASAVLATFIVLLHPQFYTNVRIPLKEYAIAQHVVNQTARIVADIALSSAPEVTSSYVTIWVRVGVN